MSPNDGATPATVVGREWIIDIAGGDVALEISTCADCQSSWFPPARTCLNCLSEATTLGQTQPGAAVVYASTTVRAAPVRFGPPYVLAYIDVSGVRLLAQVRSDTAPAPGTPVALRRGVIARDGNGIHESWVAYPTSEPNEGMPSWQLASS